jgi:PKD domain/Fibronectin type III domain
MKMKRLSPKVLLVLLGIMVCSLVTEAQTVANYAVTRTTGITFNSIMSTGTPCNSWRYVGGFQQDDNRSNPINIGFDYWYNGIRYTELSVSTNGYIDFSNSTNNGGPTTAPYGYGNFQFSANGGTLNAIAPFYDDQTTQGGTDPLGNSIRSIVTGTAPNRVLTIEWNDMAVYLNTTPSLTYQVKLYERTGVIEMVYGTMIQGTSNFTYTCGINAANMNFAPTAAQLKCQQTANTTTFTNGVQNNLTVLPASNSRLTFTPPVPANPGSTLSFTNVQPNQMTLNWTNWATNEVGYVIYSSVDNVNWEFELQTAANATSATVTALYSGTTYYWRVYAVTEGALSNPVLGTQATAPGTTFISVQSGNWSTGSTWNTGTVPTATDNVIINNTHTVTINANAACHNLTIGQGTSGILRIGTGAAARTFTVEGNVTILANAIFTVNTASNATHSFVCTGNISNAGTLDFQPDANSFCNSVFNHGYANQTIAGNGALMRFNLIEVNKGISMSRVLDVTSNTFTAPAGFLTITNGTFRLSSTGAVNITPFNVTDDIPYRGRLWMNSAASTMNTTGGNINLYGELRCSAGILNIGNAANNSISSNGGLFVVTGGTVNVAGRYERPNTTAISRFTITGGTCILNTIGSTSTTLAPFQMDVPGSQFNESGGTIIIRREGGTGAQNLGFTCTGGNINAVTGGTLQIGDASTPVTQQMLINTVSPVGNLLVNSANATAQLSVNPLTVFLDVTINSGILLASNFNITLGRNWQNNGGTYTAGTNTTTFNGTSAGTITRTSGAENFNNISFTGSGVKTLGSAISCNNITIAAGSVFSAGTSGFNISMRGNWSNAGTFNAGSAGVVTCNGTTAQTIGGTAITTFRHLTIVNAAGVSITSDQNIRGTLSLNTGVFTTTGFNFTLLSDVNGTARIGRITGGDITGPIVQQRYIYQGPTNWRQIAAPVDAQTLQDWNDDIYTAGFPGSDYPNMNGFYSIATYNETATGPKEYGYSPPANITDPINPLRGYFVYIGPLAVTMDVKGNPRKFNQTFALTYTPSAGATQDGWNMLSNPFPSAISWDSSGWSRIGTDNVLYIWNPVNNQYATYVGGIGTNGGTAHIPSSQAFWVRAVAANPAVSITEAVKTSQDPSFFRSMPANVNYLLKLKLTAPNGADETVIRFDPAAGNQFDIGYDALKLASTDTLAPYIASTNDSVMDYSINTLGALSGEVTVPLRVYRRNSGTMTISRDSVSDFPNGACIILEDLQTGMTTALSEGASYSYAHVGGDTSVRFLLHFSPDITTGAHHSICPSTADAFAWANGIGNGPWDYTWKDSTGATIAMHSGVNGTDTVFNLMPGIYTVIIDGNSGWCGTREDTVHVNGPSLLAATVNIIQPVCPLDANGSIELTGTTGRTGPYSYLWSDGSTDSLITGIGAGNWTVVVSDANNCPDTMLFTVTNASLLHADFTFASDTVIMPNLVSILNYSNYASGWNWDFGDQIGTATDANPYYAYNAPGTYYVTLTAYDSLCSDTAVHAIVILDNVSVEENTSTQIAMINVHDGVELLFTDNSADKSNVELYNANGALVFTQQINPENGRVFVDMRSFAAGVYVIRVSNSEGVFGKKFVWMQQ